MKIVEEKREVYFFPEEMLIIVKVNGNEVAYQYYNNKKEFNAVYKALKIRQAKKALKTLKEVANNEN